MVIFFALSISEFYIATSSLYQASGWSQPMILQVQTRPVSWLIQVFTVVIWPVTPMWMAVPKVQGDIVPQPNPFKRCPGLIARTWDYESRERDSLPGSTTDFLSHPKVTFLICFPSCLLPLFIKL